MSRFSLEGIAKHADAIDKEWDLKASVAERKFRSTILPQVAEYPHLQKLPSPVQALLVTEIDAANNLLSSADEPRDLDDKITCDCEFYRKYQLPYRDIWVQHILFNTLQEEHFARWAFMWEDQGFELYEGISSEYYTRDVDSEVGAPARRRLDLRETLESLKSKYYDLEETVTQLPPDLADDVIKRWVARLEHITGPLRAIGIADLRAELQAQYEVVEGARNPLGGSIYY